MPTPTIGELWDQAAKSCKPYDEIYQFGAENGSGLNWLDMQNEIVEALEGSHYSDVANTLQKTQNSLQNLYLSGKPALEAIFRNILVIGYSISDRGLTITQVIEKIAEQLSSAGHTVSSRDFTIGTIAANGGNAGGGAVYRTTKDKNNATMEWAQTGTVKMEVVQDKNTGTQPGSERIRYFGSGIVKQDEIDIGTATNEEKTMSFKTSKSNTAMVVDGSFENFSGASDSNPNSAVQGQWVLYSSGTTKDATIVQIIDNGSSSKDIFRFHSNTDSDNPNGKALKFTKDGCIRQYVGRSNKRFQEGVPYILVIRWMRKASATGDLTIYLGSQSATVSLATGTNDVWNTLVLGASTSTGDQKGWYDNFKEDWTHGGLDPNDGVGVRVEIEVGSLAVGTVIVDEVVCEPGTLFNGFFWWNIAAGADSDMLKGDYYTVSDTANDTGRMQYTVARYYNRTFPSTTSGETYPDA